MADLDLDTPVCPECGSIFDRAPFTEDKRPPVGSCMVDGDYSVAVCRCGITIDGEVKLPTLRSHTPTPVLAELERLRRELRRAEVNIHVARAKVEELEDAEHERRRQWARIEVGDIDDDARKVCLEVQEDAARTLAACLLGAIGDAPNYIEQVLDIGGNTSMSLAFADVSLVVTTQRAGAKTPHQLRMEAEAERDQARAELAALRALLDTPTGALAARSPFNGCNLHLDCDQADAEARASGKASAEHWYDDHGEE